MKLKFRYIKPSDGKKAARNNNKIKLKAAAVCTAALVITTAAVGAGWNLANSSVDGIAYAESNGEISVYINDERVIFEDVRPISENDRTLVPMRAIFEALGAEVEWDEETSTAIADDGENVIEIQIDNNIMLKNGEEIELDVPARLIDDSRTVVPVRAVSEAFECSVSWSESDQTVNITTKDYKRDVMKDTLVTDEYRYEFLEGTYNGIDIYGKAGEYMAAEPVVISDSSGTRYAEAVNKFAELVPEANVYNILAPNSAEFYAPFGKKQDCASAIRKIYSQLSNDVVPINVVQTLMDHAGENIFFKTDHHWTQRGAYYAYLEYADAIGLSVPALGEFENETIYGYEGSFVNFTSGTNGSELLKANADVLEKFYPIVEYSGKAYNDMYLSDYICDVSAVMRNENSYSAFMNGDYPIGVYETNVNNGRSVVIIKESYGNAFAVWALNNYEKVYMVDSRMFNGFVYGEQHNNPFKIKEFYDAVGGFDDLVIINYPVAAANGDLISSLENMVN